MWMKWKVLHIFCFHQKKMSQMLFCMFCLFSFLKWFIKRLSVDKSCYSDSTRRNYYNLFDFCTYKSKTWIIFKQMNFYSSQKFLFLLLLEKHQVFPLLIVITHKHLPACFFLALISVQGRKERQIMSIYYTSIREQSKINSFDLYKRYIVFIIRCYEHFTVIVKFLLNYLLAWKNDIDR